MSSPFHRFHLHHHPKGVKATLVFVTLGTLSLIWLLLRTGRKPSRILYPCQQIAGSNALLFLGWIGALVTSNILYTSAKRKKHLFVTLGATVFSILLVYTGYVRFVHTHTALGAGTWVDPPNNPSPVCPNGNCATWPNPRVVSVKNTNAVNGTVVESCPSPYTSPSCYFSSSKVNQSTIDTMMNDTVMALTGTNSVPSAWTNLFMNKFGTDYQTGENIGIKVNWNNSHPSYGSPGLFNPIPQTMVSLLRQLRNKGVSDANIYIYDCSRPMYRYFTNYVYDPDNSGAPEFPGIHYVATAIESDKPVVWQTPHQGSLMQFTGYPSEYICQEVETTFDYIINVPLLRAHGGTGVTLGFKNHLGSIYQDPAGNPPRIYNIHDGINPPQNESLNINNPLVGINGQTPNGFHAIRDKTVLIVGDGLYAGKDTNTSAPDTIYETLFLSQDPVAIDSVMFDHLNTFITRTLTQGSHNYLHAAALSPSQGGQGLGVHEHWDSQASRHYNHIDYIACSPTCPTVPTPTPSQIPGDGNQDGIVDGADYFLWMTHYGQTTGSGPTNGDFNNDGTVDGIDYVIWLTHYG